VLLVAPAPPDQVDIFGEALDSRLTNTSEAVVKREYEGEAEQHNRDEMAPPTTTMATPGCTHVRRVSAITLTAPSITSSRSASLIG